MQALAQRCAYTHEMLAKKLGKSRVAVTESLALKAMPDEVKNLCRLADIASKSLLLQVVRQGDPQKMIALVERIASQGGATREEVRKAAAKPKPGRPQGLHLQLSTAHESLQPPPQFPQGQGRARRDHRGAGSHPRRPRSPATSAEPGSFRFLGFFRLGRSGFARISSRSDSASVARASGQPSAAVRRVAHAARGRTRISADDTANPSPETRRAETAPEAPETR